MHKKMYTLHNYEINTYLFRTLCCRIPESTGEFMHIINIFCINPNSDVSHRYRRRTVTELLVSREAFPQSGQNIEHFQFFVQ